jgi:hypothetical protein
MGEIHLRLAGQLGRNFIPQEFLPPGEHEDYLRDQQQTKPLDRWRHLRADELEALVRNGNTCDDWDKVLVSTPFNPRLVKNCEFAGLVRIGTLENVVLEHHEMVISTGIANSLIISCDLGDNVAIRNVRYMAHCIVGDCVVLLNIDEMNTTNHAKFGNGIIKDGEPESNRVWIDLMNEAGGRSVMPFDGMTPADAYLWAKYRDDALLQERLREITQRQFDSRRGFYGTIGDYCVIKNSRIFKDVKIGPHAYIKGANKLKNLTINSSEDEPTQIGEGVEMVNGIVGLGSFVFYGCKAVRFVLGNNSKLKYGARLIHSYLGDNSTVSCCEILNNLVFPAHEQHHNNSFLVAALVMGQSNIAAGATIGSNHNSRANDGEIQAGRGFWPGLCTTLKHSCRFASFTLLVKGNYPAELDMPLPFCLINDNVSQGRLELMPAFWWTHDMYALARNAWKFRTRDKRKTPGQNIEFDYLAPDTVEEILRARRLLEAWIAKAHCLKTDEAIDALSEAELASRGRQLLESSDAATAYLEVQAEGVEDSLRQVVVIKPRRAYHAYREMLHHYAVGNLIAYLEANPRMMLDSMCRELAGPRQAQWVNFGGQLVPEPDVAALRRDIGAGSLASWDAIHSRLASLWARYPLDKQRHAMAVLLGLLGTNSLTAKSWNDALDEAVRIQRFVCDQVYLTRKKDYDNPFRSMTYRNAEEKLAVIGTVENNGFVKQTRRDTDAFLRRIEAVRQRGS